jgi:Ca2+-binding EF-hand superfamily protein
MAGYGQPGQGGYAGQQGQGGYGGPQGGNQLVFQWFQAVDVDRSGHINAIELQQALVNGNMSKFSEEACRMMIDLFDANKSGTIDVNEFVQLFNYINQWKGVFQGFDKDRSGSIDLNEFSQALQQMQYRFSQTFVQNILTKYDPKTCRLTLDNFIVVCFSLKRLTDSFKRRDREMRGQAMMGYEDFVGLALGAHQ